MVVPHALEKVIQEFLLINAANLPDLGHNITGSQVRLVLREDASAVGVTERLDVFAHAILDVFLIVSHIFLLLEQALPLLLLFLLFTLLFELFHLFLLPLLFSFLLDCVQFVLLFLLGVFWTVDPLNMRLGLVILVHQGHDFVEFGLVLSFLLGVASLRLNIGVSCLNVGDFDGAERGGGVLLFISDHNIGLLLLLLPLSGPVL